jgi:REP element-mobilizing transposase RayT
MDIFTDDRDRRRFLGLFAAIVPRFRLECVAYCLMSTHYHLVLRTLEANLSLAMRTFNGDFAKWWNVRHKHVGHVFQGRYDARIVQTERYLTTVCRYTALNPVRAGLVALQHQYYWSSYRATIGLDPAPDFLFPHVLLSQFSDDEAVARLQYRAFVNAPGASTNEIPRPIGIVIGDVDFAARLHPPAEETSAEVSERNVCEFKPTLNAVFAGATTIPQQRARIPEAYLRYRYSMAAIASYLGVHYSTVSRILRIYERAGSGVHGT